MTDTQLIDGKAVAARILGMTEAAVSRMTAKHHVTPGLAVVLVGDDPASQIYVSSKAKKTSELGMASFEIRLPASTSEAELLREIETLNADQAVHGILVQLPLPDHINPDTIISAIDPAKDVDGLHPISAGLLFSGRPRLVPCTPQGCMFLLSEVYPNLAGLKALVIGRSLLFGRPMSQLLLQANATVTMAHSKTKDLRAEAQSADILVAAIGNAQFVPGDWIKDGATVIDVGINRVPAPEKGEGKTRIVGDVNTSEAMGTARAITPVPGGVGPTTIACLMRNTVLAAAAHIHLSPEEVGL